ncbi:MAG: OmpA family protein [Pseudomonadota bacterium]
MLALSCTEPATSWRRVSLRAGLVAALLSTAGCGVLFDDPETANTPPPFEDGQGREAFAEALADEYLLYASRAYDRGDFDTSDFYSARSILASETKLPTLSPVPSIGIDDAERKAAEDRREALEIVLQGGATRERPRQAAIAQVAYDCYMRELIRRGADLSLCDERSENAVAALETLQQPAVAGVLEPGAAKPGDAKATTAPVLLTSAAAGSVDGPNYVYAGHYNSDGKFVAAPRGADPKVFAKRVDQGKVSRKAQRRAAKRVAKREIYDIREAAKPRRGDFALFFQFASSDVTEDGLDKIEDAAGLIKDRNATKIVLYGHADRKGPRWLNKQLSMRRAQAVRQALVQAAGGQLEVEIVALGESAPTIETGDGIADVMNRRVEIEIVSGS